MNIGIDAKPLSNNKTGVGIYLEEIMKRINKEDRENHYFLYTSKEFKADFKLNDNFILKQKIAKNKIGHLLYFLTLHKRLKEDNIDVYWGTSYFLPKRNKYTKNIKFVTTIHDLAINKFKDVGSRSTRIMHKLFLKRSIKSANEIIAVSEATKKDVIDIFGVNEDKVHAIYSGATFNTEMNIDEKQEKEIREKFKLQGDTPYIFFLSTIEPRKNIETLIKAFNHVKEKENTNLKLILAGGLGWKYENILKAYEESKYKEDIVMPGYISKEEKKYLYANAKCFVYPSLYEGFGLPVLEAMAYKTLVVTANNSSLPEVGGNVAFYYNNVFDYEELGNKIIETVNLDENKRNEKIEEGSKQIEKFTWEKCVTETIKVLLENNN